MKLSKILADAFGYKATESFDSGRCALCGGTDAYVVPLRSVIKVTTADLADTFKAGGNHICVNCHSIFSDSRFTGNLLTVDGVGYKPFVALSSATEERPAWTNLVKQLKHGDETIAVMTLNTKRRLWPRAPLSRVGQQWRVLFVDGDIDAVLTADIDRLRECLELVEALHTQGISKDAIKTDLYSMPLKVLGQIGIEYIDEQEAALKTWRGSHEFHIAVFIAQKREQDGL